MSERADGFASKPVMPDEHAKRLESEIDHTPVTASSRFVRFLPLAAIAIGVAMFFAFGLDRL